MPIAVQCDECDHDWEERPAMAGRAVECPECGAKNRVSRTAQKSSSQSSNLPRVVLVGSCIFLVGVLGMLAIKLTPIFLAEAEREDNSAVATDPANGNGPDPEAIDISDSATTAIAVTPDSSTTVGTETEAPSAADVETSVDANAESAVNSDRGRELMARMSDVGIKVTGFTADVRGTVSEAVRTAVRGAIEKCQVTVRAPNTEPIMHIELELRGEKLVMSAKLIAADGQRQVRVWERSGAVTTLDEKATVTGILPTNLSRDVETFFKSLRLEFNDARRQFSQ